MFRQDNRGFTLLEMLVVSAIFVLTLTALVSIFVSTNQAQKRVANSEKLQADTRYVIETMVREIRNNRIYYSYYDGSDGKNLASQPVTYLALLDSDDLSIIFRIDDSKIQIQRGLPNSDWHDVTPIDISVIQLKLYITPTSDPFVLYSDIRPDEQPFVQISLTTQSLTPDLDDYKMLRYQTAISSRYYAR